MRGERLELLVHKTENLSNNVRLLFTFLILRILLYNIFKATTFRNTSRHLARSMFWKSVKLYVIIGVVLTVIIYFIVSMACGGLAWQNCVGNK